MASPHALIFSLLILTTSVFTNAAPSPAPSPAHHHGGHHRHPHSHPPAKAPAATTYPSKPPTSQPPAKPPTTTEPPAKPPTTTYPPVKPPTSAPAKSPSPAPAPYHPLPRKFVAVQGVVYCKNCSYVGVATLLGASPLPGAVVELRCRNTKYPMKATATTDKNGYFFLKAPQQITTYGAHKCRAFLAQKPKYSGPCGKATNLNGGVSGGFPILDKSQYSQSKNSSQSLPNFYVYNVGPFAYEPIKCYKH